MQRLRWENYLDLNGSKQISRRGHFCWRAKYVALIYRIHHWSANRCVVAIRRPTKVGCIWYGSRFTVRFQIHCESETFLFLSRNDSRSNQNHFVKSFGPFVEMFQIQWKWEGSESESLETPILSFHGCSTKAWNVSNRFTCETFRFFPIWNCSRWFKSESKTFHLAKWVIVSHC
jgi:hypothetical protein